MTNNTKNAPISHQDLVLSYHRVRLAVGILGVILPVILIIGGILSNNHLEPSISDFYHTTLRDIFVGTMFAIGIFLISYKGYQRDEGDWFSDDWVATLAGIAAFGLALFPNESQAVVTVSQEALGLKVSSIFHYASALTFFVCLGIFCYYQFPKTAQPTRRKIYFMCGHIIVISTILITITSYMKVKGSPEMKAMVVDWNLVLWLEAIGVWAFAFSWLTKGKAELAFSKTARKAHAQAQAAKLNNA